MTFHTADFNGPGDLKDFVNTNSIAKTDIQQVFCYDGRWYLFYWA
jgi:hypothetical protein